MKDSTEYSWTEFRRLSRGLTAWDWIAIIWRALPTILWNAVLIATVWKVWR